MVGFLKKSLIPLVVGIVITCGIIARHNAEQWQVSYVEALRLYELEQYEEALVHIERSLNKADGPLGAFGELRATILNLQGLALMELGRYDEAEAAYMRSMELEDFWVGREANPDYATMLRNVALLRIEQERYEEALVLGKQALDIYKEAGSVDVAFALLTLANASAETGDYQQGWEYAQAAVAAIEADFPEDVYNLVISLHWQAYSGSWLGLDDEVEAVLLKALSAAEQAPLLATGPLELLEELYDKQGRLGDMEKLYLQRIAAAADALENSEEATAGGEPSDSPQAHLSGALLRLAHFYFQSEQYSKAVQQYLRASELDGDLYGEGHFYVAVGLNDLGVAYEMAGDYASAEATYMKALALLEGGSEPDADRLYFVLQNLSNTYGKNGQMGKQAEVKQRMQALVAAGAGSAIEEPEAVAVPQSAALPVPSGG